MGNREQKGIWLRQLFLEKVCLLQKRKKIRRTIPFPNSFTPLSENTGDRHCETCSTNWARLIIQVWFKFSPFNICLYNRNRKSQNCQKSQNQRSSSLFVVNEIVKLYMTTRSFYSYVLGSSKYERIKPIPYCKNCCNCINEILRSLSENSYKLFHPKGPNFLRSWTTAWKKQRPNSIRCQAREFNFTDVKKFGSEIGFPA